MTSRQTDRGCDADVEGETDVTVFENLRAMPRAWFVSEVTALSDVEGINAVRTSRLPDGRAFDPRAVAIVDPANQPPTSHFSPGPSAARLVRVGDGEGATWVSVLAFDPRAIEQADKFIKGARVYVEGRLSCDEWTNAEGVKRFGLSVMSWHCRLSEIGRNKKPQPKRNGDAKPPAQNKSAAAGSAGQDFNDEIPF